MRVCIDTPVLIDILKDEFREFQDMLYTALEAGETLVSPAIVYGELMPQFRGDTRLLKEFLEEHKIVIKSLDTDSVSVAATAWLKYLKRKTRMKCPHCGRRLDIKAHFLSDFYIGGFAAAKCDAILTRDRGIYRKYFPKLSGYGGCLKN